MFLFRLAAAGVTRFSPCTMLFCVQSLNNRDVSRYARATLGARYATPTADADDFPYSDFRFPSRFNESAPKKNEAKRRMTSQLAAAITMSLHKTVDGGGFP